MARNSSNDKKPGADMDIKGTQCAAESGQVCRAKGMVETWGPQPCKSWWAQAEGRNGTGGDHKGEQEKRGCFFNADLFMK